MDEQRQRHWKNRGRRGDSVFITTTCLDFVHAFDRADIKDEMCRFIFAAMPQECAHNRLPPFHGINS